MWWVGGMHELCKCIGAIVLARLIARGMGYPYDDIEIKQNSYAIWQPSSSGRGVVQHKKVGKLKVFLAMVDLILETKKQLMNGWSPKLVAILQKLETDPDMRVPFVYRCKILGARCTNVWKSCVKVDIADKAAITEFVDITNPLPTMSRNRRLSGPQRCAVFQLNIVCSTVPTYTSCPTASCTAYTLAIS